MAADASGTLWFESGVNGEVSKAISSTSVEVVSASVEAPRHRGARSGEGPSMRRKPPSRLAADGAGGLIVAAPTAVLRFAPPSPVTLAGTTAPSKDAGDRGPLAGDGGPMGSARFTRVAALAADPSGNVYVADEIDRRSSAIAIRFLNRGERPVTFFAGTAHELTVAPGAIDTIAGGNRPTGRLVAAPPALAAGADRLYIGAAVPGPRPRGVVRVLNLGGGNTEMNGRTVAPGAAVEVITVARPVRSRPGADGTVLPALSGIATGDANLYLAEPANHRVRRVDAAGAVTTIAGTGAPGFNGNDRPAIESRLSRPFDVEVGAQGRVYIADSGNNQVRFVDSAGLLHVALGNGLTSTWTCTSKEGTSSPLPAQPVSLVVSDGNVFVVSASLRQVLRLSPSGKLNAVAGRPPGSCERPDGCPVDDSATPLQADLAGVVAVANGPRGSLYVIEAARVRLLNLAKRPVTGHGVLVPAGAMRTVAGVVPSAGGRPGAASASPAGTFADLPPPTPDGGMAVGPVTAASFTAVAFDGRGNIAIGDALVGPFLFRSSVRLVDARGVITTVVPRPQPRPDGSVDRTRCCASVDRLRFDEAGNLYIADTVTRRVWFLNRSPAPAVVHGVSVAPGSVEAVAGASAGGNQEERIPALEAKLSRPRGLALGPAGSLYVVDWREHSVHRVDSRGTITTVFGTGQPGFNGDGLRGQLTALDNPVEVAIDGCGNMLIVDTGNNRVRRLNLVVSCQAGGPGAPPQGTAGRSAGARTAAVVVVVGGLGAAGAAVVVRRGRGGGPARRAGGS